MLSIWATLLFLTPLRAQPASAILSAGYNAPVRPFIAPGMVLTLFATGLTAPDTRAAQTPLPLELAGVRAVIRHAGTGYERSMPILRIQTIECDPSTSAIGCGIRGVTVQAPFDLQPSIHWFPTLALIENGIEGHAAEFAARDASPTLLNTCHVFLLAAPGRCEPVNLITHADGSIVTDERPARGGETLVLYFVGLGLTSSAVREGEASPPDPARALLTLSAEVGGTAASIPFAGLVPGLAGLYQVNVRMPDVAPPNLLSPGRVSLRVGAPGFNGFYGLPAIW